MSDTDIHFTVDDLKLKNIVLGVQLWIDWFRWSGNPWVNEDNGNTYCFFCIEDEPNHTPECVFARAKKLIEEGIVP